MIINSARRFAPLTLRMAKFMSEKNIDSINAKKLSKSGINNIPVTAQSQKKIEQQIAGYQQFNKIAYRDTMFNIYQQDGKRPVIISRKSPSTFLAWEISSTGAFLALCWEIYAGTFSYAITGITGIATLILSRESLYRLFRQTTPEIIEVWINRDKQYEIVTSNKTERLVIDASKFEFGVTPKINKWYYQTINFMNLNKIFPDKVSGYWCTIDGQTYWLSGSARISDTMFRPLI